LKSFINVKERYPMTTIGVPTQTSFAVHQQNKLTLELLKLQKLVDEFKVKLVQMEEEMDVIKIENNVLKSKIKEITSVSSSAVKRR
jgi:regulator of replication initiation timing